MLPVDHTKPGAASLRSRFHAAILPATLWFVATLSLRGDIGKWNDDYIYTQRDPATGAIESLLLDRKVHYFRPLYRVIEPFLHTALSQNLAIHHTLTAVVHGLTALVLWRFILALGVCRQAAAIGSLVLLLHPAGYEVPLWNAAMPTALSTMIVIALMLVAANRPTRRVWMLAYPLGAFAAASLNEQPVAALAAIPLVFLATSPRTSRYAAVFAKSLLPTFLAGGASILYVALHMKTTPKLPPGAAGSSVQLSDLPQRAIELGGNVAEYLTLHEFASGAFLRALEIIAQRPLWSGILAATLCVAAGLWIHFHAAHGHDVPRRPGDASPIRIIILGIAVFALCWIPIVRIHYWMSPRLCYPPMLGIAIVAAGAAHAGMLAIRESPWARFSRMLAAAITLAVAAPSLLVWIGAQGAYQARSAQDAREIAALTRLVPDPEPGTVFVPVHISLPSNRTHANRYDRLFRGVFMSMWSARWAVQQAYRRDDLSSGWCEWEGSGLLRSNAHKGEVRSIGFTPWAKIVPFIIDDHGELSLVELDRGTGREIRPRQAD